MSPLRQTLFGLALLGLVALLIWGQQQRITVAQAQTELAEAKATRAREDAHRNLTTANSLTSTLQQERAAQTALRTQQDQLRLGLEKRERTIKELKRENAELRDWAAQPLPDVARRLRKRPDVTGADAYHQWLSGRGAVPVTGDPPTQ